MRKKYLSALLFGALLFASAGTFTSCKDYDDDISNLQGQVDGIKADLDDLQAQISAGKWITNVAAISGGFTVTFSDGQSFDIVNGKDGADGANGADGAPGAAGAPGTQITIGEDGYWYFDGEKSEYLAVAGEDGKINVPTIQNGVWYIVNEEGELEATTYKANGATYAVAEANGGFTIYAPNADGTGMVECYFPGAAGSITEMTLGDKTSQEGNRYTLNGSPVALDSTEVLISHREFKFDSKTNAVSEVSSAKAWMGNKALPNDGDWVYSSPTSIDLRIDPVNIPANDVKFYLTDSKNSNLTPFVFAASASQDSNSGPMTNTNGRAAVTGNGLWTLKMQNVVVADGSDTNVWNDLNNNYVYAVNADNAFRSKYELTVKRVDPESLTQLSIKGVDKSGKSSTFTTAVNNTTAVSTDTITFKTGVAYKVNGVESSALYDMYLSADASDVEVYGLTFDQNNHTFTIGKNPDVSSIPAQFTMFVYTVANDGKVSKASIIVQINSAINAPAEYTLIEHNVNKAPNTNYFGIDLAIMKTALGGNLNQWMQNVDLNKTEIVWSEKENFSTSDKLDAINGSASSGVLNGIKASVVNALTSKTDGNHKPTTDRNKANFIQIDVNNADVKGLKLDHTYYIKATFKTEQNEILNSIIVPVEFHAPKLADLFTQKSLYVEDNVINAYFYKVKDVIADGHKYTDNTLTVNLDRYFSAFVADAKVKFADGNVGETGKKATDLFTWNTVELATENTTSNSNYKDVDGDGRNEQVFATLDAKNNVTHATTLGFNTANDGIKGGKPANGYGEVLTIEVNKSFYNNEFGTTTGWLYTQSGDDKYSFQIRLMSPIYEGGVKPVEGDAITIDANDLAKGASITSSMITGYDYNNVPFSAVPDDPHIYTEPTLIYNGVDVKNVSAEDYLHAQIEKIIPSVDKDNYIQFVEIISAYRRYSDAPIVPGEFKIYGTSTSVSGTVNMPVTVTDVWGYELEAEIPLTIQRNK